MSTVHFLIVLFIIFILNTEENLGKRNQNVPQEGDFIKTFVKKVREAYNGTRIGESQTASEFVSTENVIEVEQLRTMENLNENGFQQIKEAKKPVVLTMKQGLVMNQILGTYALDKLEPGLCKSHTQEFKTALRAFEPWALKMFDSSSKLPSGILNGNLVEFGSFKQCILIEEETDSGVIKGKHCSLVVTPTEFLIRKILSYRNIPEKRWSKIKLQVEKAVLVWSVCVPHSCSSDEVFQHFNVNIIELTQGLNLTVSLDEENCVTADDFPKMGTAEYLIVVQSVITTTTILASRALKVFSIYTNFGKLISKSEIHNELSCLNGVRSLSTAYVVIGHRYLLAMFFPLENYLDTLDWALKYSSTLIIGATVSVDTFFMISAMLTTMAFFEYVDKYQKFNPLLFYIYRNMRITPGIGLTVLFYAMLTPYFGSGPLWYYTYRQQQTVCRYFWWATVLHIQNYVNPETLCIVQTWFSSCDMIYFYLAPTILYPLWKWRKFGYLVLIACYLISLSVSFYLAWVNEYEGGMPVTGQLFETKYFQRHYIAPHTRAPTYILGIAFGDLIHRTKAKKMRIGTIVNISGWLMASIFMVFAVVGCHVFQLEDHPYNRLESSLFISCSRSIWVFGLMWIIWSCKHGSGGIVNYILCWHIFRVLGRISYAVFLFHLVLMILKHGAEKTTTHFSDFEMVYEATADIGFMIIFGFFFTLCYEMPINNLGSLLLIKKDSRVIKPQK